MLKVTICLYRQFVFQTWRKRESAYAGGSFHPGGLVVKLTSQLFDFVCPFKLMMISRVNRESYRDQV